MKTLSLLCCCLVILVFTSCSRSKKGKLPSHNIITQTRNISDFNQIVFTGLGNLFISQGDNESVNIEGEEEIVNLLTAQVIDKTLRIEYKKSNANGLINPKAPVNIHVQFKSIQEIRLSGSGTISTLTPLNAFQLKISLNGSGRGEIDVTSNKLSVILSGSSHFVVKGTVENQNIWINGSGIYQSNSLLSKIANVNITGTGNAIVNAQDELDVHISGSGTVIYQGTPRIHQSISGDGSVMPQ